MKILTILMLLNSILISIVNAEEKITVELSSDKVLLDEQVVATIKVETDSDEEPQVNIDTVNADIIASGYQGVSQSSMYVNGKITTKKEFIFTATLQAKSLGRAALSNIFATVSGRTIRHETLWFSCVKEKENVAPVFLLAVPSKTRVYQNEGILLRYYLMTQYNDVKFDIKEFPKLNNFVKRYLQESVNKELVSYEGKRFIREQLYSLVIFPEKAKLLKIDPMRVQAVYDPNGNRDPFGFGGGSYTSKVLSSKSIDIEVMEVPSEKTPTGYTGLVGKHKFSLTVSKSKVLVNEPVEIKLKITGNGNLEGADAPTIINDSAFETFDTNSAFELIDTTTASKTFEYTYLPRKATKVPAQKIPLSYFNPDTKEFETVEVEFPGIEVVGGVYQEKNNQSNNDSALTPHSNIDIDSNKTKKPIQAIEVPRYAPPIFENSKKGATLLDITNWVLISVVIILFLILVWENRFIVIGNRSSRYKQKLQSIASQGITYSSLEDLLLDFPKLQSSFSIKEKFEHLKIPSNVKERLQVLVDRLNDNYKDSGSLNNNPIQTWRDYRKELCHLVQSLEDWDKAKDNHENL